MLSSCRTYFCKDLYHCISVFCRQIAVDGCHSITGRSPLSSWFHSGDSCDSSSGRVWWWRNGKRLLFMFYGHLLSVSACFSHARGVHWIAHSSRRAVASFAQTIHRKHSLSLTMSEFQVWLAIEIIVPILLFAMLALIRTQDFTENHATCERSGLFVHFLRMSGLPDKLFRQMKKFSLKIGYIFNCIAGHYASKGFPSAGLAPFLNGWLCFFTNRSGFHFYHRSWIFELFPFPHLL